MRQIGLVEVAKALQFERARFGWRTSYVTINTNILETQLSIFIKGNVNFFFSKGCLNIKQDNIC